jgi:predicted DNA-binding transcriptional regulator AlpA
VTRPTRPDVPASSQTAPLPPGRTQVSKPLDAVVGRLALRLDELAAALGVSRRAIERERSAGRFPPPDKVVGRMPIWSPDTIRRWVEGGNGR